MNDGHRAKEVEKFLRESVALIRDPRHWITGQRRGVGLTTRKTLYCALGAMDEVERRSLRCTNVRSRAQSELAKACIEVTRKMGSRRFDHRMPDQDIIALTNDGGGHNIILAAFDKAIVRLEADRKCEEQRLIEKQREEVVMVRATEAELVVAGD